MEDRNRYRPSLFWPIVLIGVGVIWMLGNLGIVGSDNIAALLSLWPLLLIVAGLDLIIGRISRWASALIGLVSLGLALVLMLVGPRLGLGGGYRGWGQPYSSEVKTVRFTEDIAGAISASVALDLSSDPVTISALSAADKLFEADVTTFGEMYFEVQGRTERSIQLGRRGSLLSFRLPNLDSARLRWDIRLSPVVATALSIEGGSGSSTVDLSAMQLSDLDVDSGSGSIGLTLPVARRPYAAEMEGGSGSFRLVVPDECLIDATCKVHSGSWTIAVGAGSEGVLRLDGGSGSVSITVPRGMAMRLDVRDSGSGSIRIPSQLVEVSRGRDDIGVWETRDYDRTESRLEIIIRDMSSGSITIR